MPRHRSPQMVSALLESRPVVTFDEIQSTLDKASRATVFRYLKKVPYRRSYNQNGRYYTRHEPCRYDRLGLWAHNGIYFSRDGSLKATVYRFVEEGDAGWTHRELRDLLRVRVQFILVEAVRSRAIDRERMEGVYVYVNKDPVVKAAQLERRRQRIREAAAAADVVALEVAGAVVIQVLLVLLRHRGSEPADVVRRLRGHSPPVSRAHVDAVFARYQLGEKGGPSTS